MKASFGCDASFPDLYYYAIIIFSALLYSANVEVIGIHKYWEGILELTCKACLNLSQE